MAVTVAKAKRREFPIKLPFLASAQNDLYLVSNWSSTDGKWFVTNLVNGRSFWLNRDSIVALKKGEQIILTQED